MTSSKSSLCLIPALVAAALLTALAAHAQTVDRIVAPIDVAKVQALPNHHPIWAVPANDLGAIPANEPIVNLTLVLARSPEQEQAFQQLLADQQNPASPDFRKWLSPEEIGQRFGLSDNDLAAVTAWLQGQGLQVNWVAPSRIFIRFSGAAANVGRAFQTEFHEYNLHGTQLMSVSSDPMIPAALAPVIKAVRGLYTIENRPYHFVRPMQLNAPGLTLNSSTHFVAPADFNLIYDLPASLSGTGTTIGIVGESRTDMADFANFRQLTGATFPNPTEVIPTSLFGIDPGAAYTAPPSCETSNSCTTAQIDQLDAQGEATLDVFRAGSVAPGASLMLVAATPDSGGIEVDAQYLVQTTPTPIQVMSISFGACESEVGSGDVDFWDAIFQQATGEGISVLVASGDAGASECDTYFATPPANPSPNSPNYICSSSYDTCVGGTEFNDASDPSTYWSSSNNPTTLESALSYIPEGAWNEPLNSNGYTQAAATGGGVSTIIVTPSWQAGNGVPSARAGRYTPDIAFSAADHDGYLGCFAAGGGSCVNGSNGTPFVVFSGTSAAAPSMAGVAALLDQSKGAAQGNLNPDLYLMGISVPTVFHQVSIASSGVASCSVSVPSMCNNSIPSPTELTGGQAGFTLGATGGYSEVTGLGSLDVAQFIPVYGSSALMITPAVTVIPSFANITTSDSESVLVTVNGGSDTPTPTGSITLSSGTFSATTGLSNPTIGSASATFNIISGSLAVGTDTLTATYTATGTIYNSASGTATVTVTSPTPMTPSINWVTPAAINYGTALSTTQLDATASVPGTFAYNPPATTILTAGQHTLSLTFTPTDRTDYTTATDSVTITVNKATPAITWPTPAPITYGTAMSSTQLDATANTAGSFAYSPSAGRVLTAGQQTLSASFTPTDTSDYTNTTASVTLTINRATPTVSWPTPSAVAVGTVLSPTQLDATASVPGTFVYNPADGTVLSTAGNIPLNVTFTPTDATDYSITTGSVTLVVGAAGSSSFAISGTSVSVSPGATSGNTSTITVTPAGGFTGTVTLTAAATGPAGANFPPTFTWTPANGQVSITGAGNGTATLTIATTAPTSGCSAESEPQDRLPWYSGGAALACLLLFGLPAKRRKWRAFFGLVALCIALGTGISACGGNKTGTACPNISTSGTTAGTYTITVTGTSGSATSTGTVTLTVN
jgi:Pro-kumamolisin, activation domain